MDRSRYRVYRIPKARGGFREIMAPDPELKSQQRRILAWLMARRIRPSKYAHGFVKRRSTATHARLHTGRKVIVRIDIKDFFPSITERQVLAALLKEKVPRDVAQRIADVCTVEGRTPQGAPTSPFLSNVVFKRADYRLAGLARKWKATYSRYADDLIFSSDSPKLNHIYHAVRAILEDEGYRINEKKFQVCRSGNRQLVTGVVVNTKASLSRTARRILRAAIHNAREAVIAGNDPPVSLRVLEGKAAYLSGINREHGSIALR
ncbi:MAG: reverse transcriptase family protein, partial [Planctomycetes bacterium]|nr:reverse transcriptase family protein [Planctomycetota bacterium]